MMHQHRTDPPIESTLRRLDRLMDLVKLAVSLFLRRQMGDCRDVLHDIVIVAGKLHQEISREARIER